MFHVDEQPVMPRGGRQHRRGTGPEVMDAEAQRQFTRIQLLLGSVLEQCHGRLRLTGAVVACGSEGSM